MSKKNYELDELFSFSAEDVVAATKGNESKKVDEFIYSPKLSQAKDGTYRALVRFIPHLENGKPKFYFGVASCFLQKADGTGGIFVKTPREGKHWNNCPISKVAYDLYKSGDPIKQQLGKQINIQTNYYALVQVIKDTVFPENNGKVFAYKFGEIIRKKIDEAMTGSEFTEAVNVFDVFDAPAFEINLAASGKEINGNKVPTYDACKFISKTVGITLPSGSKVDASDNESKKELFDWLQSEELQKINSYKFSPWDSETEAKVKDNLATYIDNINPIKTAEAEAEESVSNIKAEEADKSVSTSGSEDLDSFLDEIM